MCKVAIHIAAGIERGVFASHDFAAGMTIAETPTWTLSPADLVHFEGMTIAGHWFHHPAAAGHGLLALGTLSLVNHSAMPNAMVLFEQRTIGYVGVLRACCAIAEGEQVFIDYSAESESSK